MADKEAPATSVLVAVRKRPLNSRERELGDDDVVKIGVDGKLDVLRSSNEEETEYRSFKFDFSYDKDARQDDVYRDVGQPMLDAAFNGFNGTIFAYGQTGSGKTWSMTGEASDDKLKGIIPRVCSALFDRIRKESAEGKKKFMVICSYFEIYNERLRDLLDPTRRVKKRGPGPQKIAELQIKESKALGVYVKGLHEVVVEHEEKVLELMLQGNSMRTQGETKMNARSSRSHSIFTMKIHQKDVDDDTRSVFARLNLVDLAGSERASKTEATGSRLKEGANINKSLMALGNVINALAEKANAKDARRKKKVFIPYRNSKLTRVLQESLGGNSLCSMLATMSPARSNIEETLSTIQYANRAKMIQVAATKNEEMSQIDALNDEIAALRKKLAQSSKGGDGVQNLSKEQQKALAAQYEKQIADINGMLSQTWDDKAKLSKQHEEERARLVEQKKKDQAEMRRQFLLERAKRWRLLEAKGDIEGILRELVSNESNGLDNITGGSGVGEGKSEDGSGKGSAKKKVGGLIASEIEKWCADFKVARDSEKAMGEQRMVLQVYRDSFEGDMKIMNGEGAGGRGVGGLRSTMSFRNKPSSPSSSSGTPTKNEADEDAMAIGGYSPMSPSSAAAAGPGVQQRLPPQRMKVILEQAHGKLGTLKSEGGVWIQHGDRCFEACKLLATRIATKLGPPPGEAPAGSANPNNQTADAPSPTPSSHSNNNATAATDSGSGAKASTTIADAPIGEVEDEVVRTRETLSAFVPGPKPPLSLKLLKRPPYRYLHDLVMALHNSTGFAEGLFDENERHSAKSTPRAVKVSFLKKLIGYTGLAINRDVRAFADPEQIVAGLECAKTNRMLQCVAEAAQVTLDSSKRSKSMDGGLSLFKELSVRTLSGELPDPSRDSTITMPGSPGDTGFQSAPDSGVSSPPKSSSGATNSQLTEDEKVGLELVLRLLRSKYLSDTARLEARRERASLFSCSSAASKLARVLRLEARKCHDDSLKMKDGEVKKDEEKDEASADKEQDAKLAEMAQNLESHASIVEPQAPSAPMNRSPEHAMRNEGEDGSDEQSDPKALDRLSHIMKALVALRRVVSDRIVRERSAEKEARSTSDAKLIELSGKHSALMRTSASQQEKIARMEADAEALRSAENRLRERVAQLEAQNIADREASAALREQVAKDSANEAVASVTAELEERLKRSEEDLSRMKGEVDDGQKELARVRADFAEAEVSAGQLKEALGEQEGKTSAALAEVENLRTTLAEAEAKAEESEESGGRADALAQEVLALQAGHELLESRAKSLAADLEKKQTEVDALASEAEKSKLLEKKLEEAEEEFHMAVEVLTEERDAARQKEEEYFEELKGTENDLADIQSGYVDLSDRLNDKTDQIFEVQEQLDAERAKKETMTEQLMQAQKDLLASTQQVAALEKQLQKQQIQNQDSTADDNKQEQEQAAPVAAAPAQLTAGGGGDGAGKVDAAVAAKEAELAEELRQRDQLIRSLQQQVEEGRERQALAGANNILVEAAGETAAESSRQLDEAMDTIENLRADLDEASKKALERKRDLEQALRERDRAVDEASREADRRVQQAVDDARRAQRELAESREEQEVMAEKLAAAERAKKVAEDAFANVSAAPVGDDMDFDAMHFDNTSKKKGRTPRSAARGGGARAARSLAQSNRYSPRDDLDNSYGADGFDSDYGDDFDD